VCSEGTLGINLCIYITYMSLGSAEKQKHCRTIAIQVQDRPASRGQWHSSCEISEPKGRNCGAHPEATSHMTPLAMPKH